MVQFRASGVANQSGKVIFRDDCDTDADTRTCYTYDVPNDRIRRERAA